MANDHEGSRVELLSATTDLAALLYRYGETHWAGWVDQARQRIDHGDMSGVDFLLGAYGGMGSLNDVVIHPLNGHQVNAEDIDLVNTQLARLRSRAYTAATSLKME